MILNVSRLSDKEKAALKVSDVELPFLPLVQSGASFDPRFGAVPDRKELAFKGPILLGAGVKYRGYHAAIARTFFICPTEEQTEQYKVFSDAFKKCTEALQVGKPLASAVEAARASMEASPKWSK